MALPAGATQVAVHVEAQAAEWAPIDTIEVYANATFTVPPPVGAQPEPLLPILCFTARAMPSQRCTMALGGARPLMVVKEPVGPAGAPPRAGRRVADASLDHQRRGRAHARGRPGQGLLALARVTGLTGLWPVIPQRSTHVVPVADLVAGKPLVDQGVPALAFTNPVFVDVDGGGWRAPFAP